MRYLALIFSLFLTASLFSNEHLKKYKIKIKEWQIPEWMVDQIESDFKPYIKGGFNKNSLQNAVYTQFSYSRLYKIKNGILDPVPNYDKTFTAASLILEAHEKWGLPEIEIVLNQNDGVKGVSGNTDIRGPILTVAKDKTINGIVLLYSFGIDGYDEVVEDTTPWNEKISKLIWRGTSTDGIDPWGCDGYNEKNWLRIPRGALVNLSNKYPDLIDAKFTGFYCFTSETMKKFFTKQNVMGNYLTRLNQIKYKYQVSPDGNICTYPGLQWRLHSGSVLFKPESNQLQWFERGLKPYIHYIPVKNDFSDLVEKINWAKTHDDEAQVIAENARKYAKQYINYDMNLKYLYLVLLRYASLCKGSKSK
jgi:hypothetical protein